MTKLIIFIIMLFLFLPQLPAQQTESDSTEAIESPWSGGLETAVTNKYLWRGIEVNKGFILQPYAWLTYQNLTFALWGNWTLTKPNNDIKRPEVDAILSYELELDDFIIESFFNYYLYIDQSDAPNTGELGCNIGYPIGIFTLNAAFIVDVMEYSGAVYLEQKIEAEQDLSEQFSVYGALTLGSGLKKFNESYFGLSKSTASVLTVEGRLTWSVCDDIYLQPYAQYNKTIDSALKDYIKKDNYCVGLTIGKEF